jgi:hypothetical protein
MNSPPCGLTQQKLDEKGWLDKNQECTSRYRDAHGVVQICGKLYTDHLHAPPGIFVKNYSHFSRNYFAGCGFSNEISVVRIKKMNPCPCGLTQEQLDLHPNLVGSNGRCTAEYADEIVNDPPDQ